MLLGKAAKALLDTYQAERLPIAREVLHSTHRNSSFVFSTNPVIQFMRDHVVVPACNLSVLQQQIVKSVNQLGVNYRTSSLSQSYEGTFSDKTPRRHEFWSIDVRYIEHHQLPEVKGPMYVISILENFSSMLLASIISGKQDTTAYLRVFAIAIDVSNPRVIETGYRFPHLTLWTLSPDERLLFKKLLDTRGTRAGRTRPIRNHVVLPLDELPF